MRFERDEEKNIANQRHHDGIDSDLASRVFEDVNYVIRKDCIDEKPGEQRWHALGLVAQIQLLLVVHVYREAEDEEVIRIISGRKATKRERGRCFQ